MTVRGMVENPARFRITFSNACLRFWHGVDIEQLTQVKVAKDLLFYTDKDGHKVENAERDPGAKPESLDLYKGKKFVGHYEVSDTAVNGIELPIGEKIPSADGNVVFERID